ncbi:hypothetical protein ACFRFL_30505 [Streptomyces sp. NPDC056708]|uniref:hypothetical protein n=1 Tax=unclassified Streptomyces TaxID=2593676 RepID=UPI0036AC9057
MSGTSAFGEKVVLPVAARLNCHFGRCRSPSGTRQQARRVVGPADVAAPAVQLLTQEGLVS